MRTEIERLMVDQGVESFDELRERFIGIWLRRAIGRDRATSLLRFELPSNGVIGGLIGSFGARITPSTLPKWS